MRPIRPQEPGNLRMRAGQIVRNPRNGNCAPEVFGERGYLLVPVEGADNAVNTKPH